MKSVLALLVAAALAGGCSGATVVQRGSSADAKKLRRSETVVQTTELKGSPPRDLSRATAGAAQRHIAQAETDLRDLGLWGRFTRHLDNIRLRALTGRAYVPRDGHLADSLYRALDSHGGRFCRVTFYPAAMRDDLMRQRFYYGRGFTRARPPAMHEFWTMILAHELTHCRDQRRGERVALAVEARVLELLRRD